MTLTELRYVLALAKERHFGRAAHRSFVSQPTLSVAIRKLEDELGVAIFERHRNEVSPTPVGERIVEQARRVIDEAQTLTTIARQGRDQVAGHLRLGAIYTVGPYLLPHLIPALRERAPQMPLLIEENFTAVLSQQLHQNELDVIIVAEPFSQPGVEIWPLYDELFEVVLPRNHRWAERQAIDSRELAEENLLLLGPGHCFRDQVLAACPGCRDTEVNGQLPVAGSSLETIRHMVASGLGVTVLPKSSTQDQSGDRGLLTTRPFSGDPPARRISLAWRSSFPRPKAIAVLHEAIMAGALEGVQFIQQTAPREAMAAAKQREPA